MSSFGDIIALSDEVDAPYVLSEIIARCCQVLSRVISCWAFGLCKCVMIAQAFKRRPLTLKF